MEIFDKIGEVATQTYKFTTEKADKFAKETKLKMKINESKSKIETLYNEIGETMYRIHTNGNSPEAEETVENSCKEIDEIAKQIIQMSDELLKIKCKRQCSNCHQEIDRDAKYCPNCGFEQEKNESNKNEENKEKTITEENDSSDEEDDK